MKYVALFLIRLYQRTLSVVLPSSCRFTPSCSQYGYEAIQRFGFFRGGWMAIRRIGRCHPFLSRRSLRSGPRTARLTRLRKVGKLSWVR